MLVERENLKFSLMIPSLLFPLAGVHEGAFIDIDNFEDEKKSFWIIGKTIGRKYLALTLSCRGYTTTESRVDRIFEVTEG